MLLPGERSGSHQPHETALIAQNLGRNLACKTAVVGTINILWVNNLEAIFLGAHFKIALKTKGQGGHERRGSNEQGASKTHHGEPMGLTCLICLIG